MIGPGTGVRVYLACGVTDMRKGIAGLAALTQDVLHQKGCVANDRLAQGSPISGHSYAASAANC